MLDRFLYEQSVSYRGHLIIPYVAVIAAEQPVYSYRLLSERSHRGRFHKAENPAALYSDHVKGIVAIAQEHLDRQHDPQSDRRENFDTSRQIDYFQNRYTYRHHLIIVIQQTHQYFYDHYPPTDLNNIAAPKLFSTETACLAWIKQGLDRNYPASTRDESGDEFSGDGYAS